MLACRRSGRPCLYPKNLYGLKKSLHGLSLLRHAPHFRISMPPVHVAMGNKLFVPGSRPELFDKAFASAADGLSFDLEDAVAEDREPHAREALRELLRSGRGRASGMTLIVQVNALDTAHFAADVAAVVQPGNAEARGVGAYVVNGKKIDPPFVKRGEAIAATARRLGLPPA